MILSNQGKLIGPGALIITMTLSFTSKTASTNSFPECHAFKSYLSPTDCSKLIYCSPESALKNTMHISASLAISFAL